MGEINNSEDPRRDILFSNPGELGNKELRGGMNRQSRNGRVREKGPMRFWGGKGEE